MNNYDKSSTGDDIELRVSYDTDMSQIYYNDFERENTRLTFGRNSSVFLIGDSSLLFYKVSQLNKMKKSELIELDEKYELLCPYNYDDTTKAELIDALRNVTIKKHYECLLATNNWRDFGDNCSHDYYVSRGYSQGDAVYIVDLDNGGYFNKENIDHILWDTPVHIYLSVNDDEELGYELLDEEYNYDKDKIAEQVKQLDISESAKEWIIDNLPSEPKYSY